MEIKHFRRLGKKDGKRAVCREPLLPLACTMADACNGLSLSFCFLQPGGRLWGKLQCGRTTCGHGLLGCSALMNWLPRHFKSTCVFVTDQMGIIDIVGLNVLMERYKL